jgi:3-deoxy-D-manno-octulosonate 8-phosphate phosphatase KdsC-like HAD superfamily phosphatase
MNVATVVMTNPKQVALIMDAVAKFIGDYSIDISYIGEVDTAVKIQDQRKRIAEVVAKVRIEDAARESNKSETPNQNEA